MPLLEVNNLVTGYGKKRTAEIVHGVTLSVDAGEFVCIIGANGCGKTTTLKAAMGLLPTWSGEVLVNGRNLAEMAEQERARHFAYIPQAHTPPFPFSVADVVLMGRTPYINRMASVTDYDRAVAQRALELLGIQQLSEKAYTTLSGGQQQLVLIARALTQQADILVLDSVRYSCPSLSLPTSSGADAQLFWARMLADMGYTGPNYVALRRWSSL